MAIERVNKLLSEKSNRDEYRERAPCFVKWHASKVDSTNVYLLWYDTGEKEFYVKSITNNTHKFRVEDVTKYHIIEGEITFKNV